jgi:hypothetical protein
MTFILSLEPGGIEPVLIIIKKPNGKRINPSSDELGAAKDSVI